MTLSMNTTYFARLILTSIVFFWIQNANAQYRFSTNYFSIEVNKKGWITSMKNIQGKTIREYARNGKSSPLLSLYNSTLKKYYTPTKGSYDAQKKQFTLRYTNGTVVVIRIEPQEKYVRLTLESVLTRKGVDDVQWGPYHTAISNLFGEVIGVARDTSDAGNFAIGVMALNDNTIGGTSDTEGDAAPFQYIIHSPDKKQYPLPANLHEGQIFPIGGDGISDVAFYSHPEPYYRILYGNAAMVDSTGNISLSYHSRDRSLPRTINFSLIPFLPTNKPNHIEVQPVQGVDYIGSSIALWGSPDSTALLDVIQDIVIKEKLPYPTVNGKWVKDPARYIPDVTARNNRYDSTISYVSQLGFKAIEAEDLPFWKVDRANEGYIDGKNAETKPFHLGAGNLSHKELSDLAAKKEILLGRHTICITLAEGTKDASPVPSDSICYQQKRLLFNAVSATDTLIEVNDPTYLEEIASWEGHAENLNIIKIGKELIHYLGVSSTKPYYLKKVKRGYWGTTAYAHASGDTVYKLQVTINYGYDGLIPNLDLQDKIAAYFATVADKSGLQFMDLDGQEFLFNNGHGYYSVKRFFRKMFESAENKIPYLRISGATLSEGSWHYQSVWNVGGGTNMYDLKTRQWGSSTSEGKDIRDVAYANYFPATFGSNFGIHEKSTVAEYEHVEAVSVGAGATYLLVLDQQDIESCPEKYKIFSTIRAWENARAANAFPRNIKKELANTALQFHLEEVDQDTWKLYKTNQDGTNPTFYALLKRDPAY